VRLGLEEAQSKDAGRRTGTGSEVWYTRDERAPVCVRCRTGRLDCKVFHLQRSVLYKSGVYALKVACLTLGGLPCALGCHMRQKFAEVEQLTLTAWESSAEGIVGEGETIPEAMEDLPH